MTDIFSKNSFFLTGASSTSHFPKTDHSEIAFIGRSNVGKSTIINILTNNKKLARVSSTPGRTQQINFFLLGQELLLVDLPGYGYAKISKKDSEKLHNLIFNYISRRKQLNMLYLLIDSRHEIKNNDLMMLKFLLKNKIPLSIILTKIDKATNQSINDNISFFSTMQQKKNNTIHSIYTISAHKKINIIELKKGIINQL